MVVRFCVLSNRAAEFTFHIKLLEQDDERTALIYSACILREIPENTAVLVDQEEQQL